jgi:Peptidase A4 family
MTVPLRVGAVALVLAMLVVLPAGVSAVSSGQNAPMIRAGFNASVSSVNWSGYAVIGPTGSVNIALASWVVPAVSCASGERSYSSYWVGIDGFSSSTVEQTGTDSDCSSGVPSYYAWYEFYPSLSHTIGAITVSPGDNIAAGVAYLPKSNAFVIAIKDFTTNASFTKSQAVASAQRTSAEFIVEAPTVCLLIRCHLASLSNFGTSSFGQDYTGLSRGAAMTCSVAINGTALASIGSFGSAVQEIAMVSQSNHDVVKAQPSPLSEDGTSFTVQWLSAGP